MSTADPLPVAEGIHLERVTKRFASRDRVVEALHEITFDVEPGELVTLIGPSGSGKTTLLRIIAGLLEPDAGTVTVGASTPDQARRAKHLAFVPQAPALLPWRTVRQNVTLLDEVNRRHRPAQPPADPDALLAQMGLAGFESAHPRQLSGGMRQRVALARAMALCAPILLMDEPFAALDEITRAEMRHVLLDVWEQSGATCVFVTHSIEEAVLLSDRVVVLSPRPGRVAAIEPVELARPRAAGIEDDPAFHDHVRRVRQALRDGKR